MTEHLFCGIAVLAWVAAATTWQIRYYRAKKRWDQAVDRQIEALAELAPLYRGKP